MVGSAIRPLPIRAGARSQQVTRPQHLGLICSYVAAKLRFVKEKPPSGMLTGSIADRR